MRRIPVAGAGRRLVFGLLVSGLLVAGAGGAFAQGVQSLLGSWGGSGKIVFKSGKPETIRCNAYNTGSVPELRLVIRCASTSYKVEIRSKLKVSDDKLAGQWEERTYNATGSASGRLQPGNLDLAIDGGGFTGKMSVSFTDTRQSVIITTEGIDMKSVDIRLGKSASQ